MTKAYFLGLAQYNEWANDRVISWLHQITDEQWTRVIVSSFNSIEQTILHIAGAEQIWADRILKESNPVWMPSTFQGNKETLIATWKRTSERLKNSIENADEAQIESEISFTKINGEHFTMPCYQILAHVFNHSTYHRGQVVTMLRQVGFTHLSSIDQSSFYKKP